MYAWVYIIPNSFRSYNDSLRVVVGLTRLPPIIMTIAVVKGVAAMSSPGTDQVYLQ